jgi:hypothetical protein
MCRPLYHVENNRIQQFITLISKKKNSRGNFHTKRLSFGKYIQDFKIGAWKVCLTLFYTDRQVKITPYLDREAYHRKKELSNNNKNKGYVSSVSWPTV